MAMSDYLLGGKLTAARTVANYWSGHSEIKNLRISHMDLKNIPMERCN